MEDRQFEGVVFKSENIFDFNIHDSWGYELIKMTNFVLSSGGLYQQTNAYWFQIPVGVSLQLFVTSTVGLTLTWMHSSLEQGIMHGQKANVTSIQKSKHSIYFMALNFQIVNNILNPTDIFSFAKP